MQIDKNILSNDLSPYLKQHKDIRLIGKFGQRNFGLCETK